MCGSLTLEGMCHCAGLSTWVPIAENKPGPESRYWVLGTVGLGLGPHPPATGSPTRFQADPQRLHILCPSPAENSVPQVLFSAMWVPGHLGPTEEP